MHPLGATLLGHRGRADVEQSDVRETRVTHPCHELADGRYAPDVAHAGVAVGRGQADRVGHHERLQHTLAAGACQRAQMAYVGFRVPAVIDHAQAENAVETGGLRQLFPPQGQHPVPWMVDVALHGAMLHAEQQRRIHTDHFPGARGQHAPAEIAIAAADVEHAMAGEAAEAGRDALPFPVRAPLRVDVHVGKAERTFTPRMQRFQGVFEAAGGWGAVDVHRGGVVETAWRHGRQRIHRCLPTGVVAVVGLAEALRAEAQRPVGQLREHPRRRGKTPS